MRKIIIISFCCLLLLTVGCEKSENDREDFNEYSFTRVSWTRDNGHDIETIRFNSDGSFSYYCACGNSINDSDLCDRYTYNEETKEIKLNCFEKTDDAITMIKIVSLTDTNLKLDFNGELRTFEKNKIEVK